ncbi:MAG: hypothetical protein V2A79_14255 [Planctomycetota bacterium]
MPWRPHSITIIDGVGGMLVGALAAAGIWQTFLKPSTASADLREWKAALADKSRDLATLEHELGNQETLLAERKEQLSAAGTLPAQTPIEDDLRTITELARRNNVRLTEVTPLGSVSYPGIKEVRYHLRGSGPCADLARMLSQFEACDFWGDITYLQIVSPKNAAGVRTDEREVDVTVAFYSAAVAPQPTDTH